MKRYPDGEARRLLKVLHNAMIEIGMTTQLGQELMEVGEKKGEQRALAQGRQELEEARASYRLQTIELIRAYLDATHPELASDPSLDSITSVETARDTLKKLYQTSTRESALEVLRTSI